MTASVFVILLVGQFTLERAGRDNPLPVPERVAAVTLVLLVFAHPILVIARKESLAPWTPGLKAVNAFFGILLISALWARPSMGLGDTVWDIFTMAACCLVLELALRLSRDTVITVFMGLSAGVGTLFALAGLLSVGQAARIAAFGGGPNVFARITGMGIVAATYFMMRNRYPRYIAAGVPLMLVATVLSGSRGAIAGAVAALLVLALTLRRRTWRRVLMSLAAMTPLLVIMYIRFGSFVAETIQTRIVRLTFQEQYTSGRDNLVPAAWDMFLAKPFAGWGLHGFEALYGPAWGFTYPHNIVVQVAAETGLIGLTALVVLVVVSLVRLGHIPWRDPTVAAPLASVALMTVASQFSGDYYDSRFLWAYLLIALSWVPNASGANQQKDQMALDVVPQRPEG